MRSPVGPADFLHIMAELQVRGDAIVTVARLLGYDLPNAASAPAPASVIAPQVSTLDAGAQEPSERIAASPPADAVELLGEVPAVIEAEPRAAATAGEPSWWADTEALEAEFPGQAWLNPTPPPLFAPERQRDILRALASRRRRGRRVDVPLLTQLLARHEPYAELPRLSEASSARSLAVVALRSRFLETFEQDVDELGRQAQALLGSDAVTVEWLAEVPRELPKAELVLIVARTRGRAEGEVPLRAWFPLVKRARASGGNVFLLSPETLLQESWQPLRTIEWSRRTHAANLRQRYARASLPATEGVTKLARLLAPAVRVEPALLRSMRLELLPEYGPELEAQLTQSRYVASANRLGITLRADKRGALLAELAPGPVSKRAFELIERAHLAVAPVQQLEERLLRWLHEKEGDWENSITSALRQATKALSRQRSGLARWVARGASQLPQALQVHDAFVEAATRAEAVLGQTLPRHAGAPALATDAAAFLGTLPDSPREVEVLLLDPESEPLRPWELDSLRELTSVADRLGVTLPWLLSKLQEPSASSFQASCLRRELRRELGSAPVTQVAVCMDEGARGLSEVRDLFSGRTNYDVTFVPPRTLAEVLERSQIVFLDFDDPNRVQLLRRAADDPTFLGILIAPRALVAAESDPLRPLVEVVEPSAGQVKAVLERLLSFSGQAPKLRVLSRRASTATARHTLPIPMSMLSTLVYGTSTTELTRDTDGPAELPRRGFTIHSGGQPLANVHVISDLWLARLARAMCFLQSEGGSRTGCLVQGAYVLTRVGGTEQMPALEVGDRLGVRLAANVVTSASVINVAGELAIVRLQPETSGFSGSEGYSLPLEDDPPASGLAVAALVVDASGFPELYWGWVQVEEQGSRLFIQRPSLNGISPQVRLGGLAVMIEGRYAGHATELTQATDGGWTARVCRAPKHLLALPEEPSAASVGSASSSRPWVPPPPPTGHELSQAIDPRVVREHQPGQLPRPSNPPAPVGWIYWQGRLTAAQREFCSRLLRDTRAFEMGSFVQALIDDRLVGARVEWHNVEGIRGPEGSLRGVSLFAPEYVPAAGSLQLGSEGPEVQRWQEFLRQQGYSSVSVDGRFGSETQARTRDFQKTQKLVADGIVGSSTYRAATHLGFDPNAAEAAPDGLVGWLVALAGVPTQTITRRVIQELHNLTKETLPKAPHVQGSRLQFRTTRGALDTLLRLRRTGALAELAGLRIVWLAEEQREPDEMDPQRGRFGSLPERNGRRLDARIQRDGKGYLVTLNVLPVGSASPLTGAVVFHLHPSFKQALYRVAVESGRATLELDVWGWFTVGVECEDGTRLELDLGDVPRPTRPAESPSAKNDSSELHSTTMMEMLVSSYSMSASSRITFRLREPLQAPLYCGLVLVAKDTRGSSLSGIITPGTDVTHAGSAYLQMGAAQYDQLAEWLNSRHGQTISVELTYKNGTLVPLEFNCHEALLFAKVPIESAHLSKPSAP